MKINYCSKLVTPINICIVRDKSCAYLLFLYSFTYYIYLVPEMIMMNA